MLPLKQCEKAVVWRNGCWVAVARHFPFYRWIPTRFSWFFLAGKESFILSISVWDGLANYSPSCWGQLWNGGEESHPTENAYIEIRNTIRLLPWSRPGIPPLRDGWNRYGSNYSVRWAASQLIQFLKTGPCVFEMRPGRRICPKYNSR